MAIVRSRSLRLLLIAATLAVVAVPWLVEPRQVAVAWYGFEFLDTPATDDATPHPGSTQCSRLPSNTTNRFSLGVTSQPSLVTPPTR